MSYGATPEEWAAWQRLAESDLLPVVMDPSSKISAMSSVKELCKTPSRFNQNGEVVGLPKWTANVSTDRDIGRWSRDSRLGICVIGRTVKAIDNDISDPDTAAAVEACVRMVLGDLPRRHRSNTSKSLFAFRCEVDFPKRVIRTEHGIIELLSNNQQFVACGTHKSGARIEWDGGVPGQLPVVPMETLDALWAGLIAEFALPDGASTERNGMIPTRPRIASDLVDSTVAWLDENGWVTGFQRDGRVDVRCPWEGGHSTDSGPTSTSYFPAGVGGFMQGHFRCLHASCSKRTDGDFMEAVGCVASDFDAAETVANAKGDEVAVPLPNFARARNGQIEPTINNLLAALRRPDVCGMHIGFDSFKDVRMCSEGDAWRPFADQDYVALRSRLEDGRNGFKPIGRELIRDATKAVAYENKFDSAIQWAGGLEWDGVERVADFWRDYFGVEDTPYTRAASVYTWSAFAARCLQPGAKCDMVPVLIGIQGGGKTSMIKALAPTPDAFGSINLEKKDEDISRGIRGKLVCELAELRGLASRESEAIKDWISREVEEWVPKYDEFSTRYGRRFLAIGTGNREGFLDDETGERRWLPMRVGHIDVDRVRADRDQLWAEGVRLFRRNGVMWQDAFKLAGAEHHKYKVGDVWCDEIEAWLARTDMEGPRDAGMVRMKDVLLSAIGLPLRQITRREELRAGKALLILGFQKRVARVDGVNTKVWVRAQSTQPDFSDLA